MTSTYSKRQSFQHGPIPPRRRQVQSRQLREAATGRAHSNATNQATTADGSRVTGALSPAENLVEFGPDLLMISVEQMGVA